MPHLGISVGDDRTGYLWQARPDGNFRWEAWTPHESGVGIEATKHDAETAIAEWFREQAASDFPELRRHG